MLYYLSSLIISLILITGCGNATGNLPIGLSDNKSDDLRPAEPMTKSVTILQPTEPYYIDQLHYKMHFAKSSIPENNHLIWLNFEGGFVTFDQMAKLGLKCSQQINLPRSELTMDEIQNVAEYVSSQFDYDLVEITTTFPETGTTFSTVHIGGKVEDLGCGKSLGPSSAVAVKDPHNNFSGDVGIVFEDSVTAIKNNTKRIVTHMIDADQPVALESKQMDVDQIHILQTMERALEELQPSDVIDISHLRPQIDAIVPARVGRLNNLNKVITILAIAGTDGNTGQFDISRAKDVLAEAANSNTANTLATIAALSGNPGFAVALDLAKIFLGSGSNGNSGPPPQLPNVNEFLGLNFTGVPLPEVLNEFQDITSYVQQEHPDQPAITEMVIFGYLQEMKKNNLTNEN